MQHVITACHLASGKRPNRQRKLYIISTNTKTSKTKTRIQILGNVRIISFANKSKF